MRRHAGNGTLNQAKAAATAKVLRKLVRKHPGVAAELALTGLGRGAKVGITETAKRLMSRLGYR